MKKSKPKSGAVKPSSGHAPIVLHSEPPNNKSAITASVTIEPELDAEGYNTKVGYVSRKDESIKGVVFHLKIDHNDRLGRTHKAKAITHFWEGTEEQFSATFTKE